MKIRTGFVSNSSSSSFVLVGFKAVEGTKLYEQIKNLDYDDVYELNLMKLKGSEGGLEDNAIAVGEEIASSDCDYMEPGKMSIKDIVNKSNDISSKLKLDTENDEIQIVWGTRSC